MNLENEISAVSGCAFNFALEDNDSERNHEEVEPCLRKADAIRIAKQFAEKCCERQREICADVYFNNPKDMPQKTYGDIMEIIKNAPLATGEKK